MQGSAAGEFPLQAAIWATENFWRYERRDRAVVIPEGAEPSELLALMEPGEVKPSKKPKKPSIWRRTYSSFAAPPTLV